MKKQLLFALFAIGLSNLASAQLSEDIDGTDKKEITLKKTDNFKSQEEKDAKIKNVEKLIKFRTSQGKTESQLARHYKELARLKKTVVLKKEETKK
jgi:hypothetical protein